MTPTTKALLAGASLLLFAGCNAEPENTAPTGSPAATSAPASRPASPTASTSTLPSGSPSASPTDSTLDVPKESLLVAGETAQTKVSGTRVTSVEQQNASAWAITVTADDGTRSKLLVGADGTSLTKGPQTERDSAAEKAAQARNLENSSLDYTLAVAKLKDVAPNGIIRELSLDSEDGTSVWKATVAEGKVVRDITLDANSGAVRSNKVER